MRTIKLAMIWLLPLLLVSEADAQLSGLDTVFFHANTETIVIGLEGERPYTRKRTFDMLKKLYEGTQMNYEREDYFAKPGKYFFYITDQVDTLAFPQWEHPKKFVRLVHQTDTLNFFISINPRERSKLSEATVSEKSGQLFIQKSKAEEFLSILIRLAYTPESDLTNAGSQVSVNEENLTSKKPHEAYNEKVDAHFQKFSSHAAVKWFDFIVSQFRRPDAKERTVKGIYSGFMTFEFSDDGTLIKSEEYKNLGFSRYLDLILEELNQFIVDSGFNEFYSENGSYYDYKKDQITQYANVMQIKDWLESKFPGEAKTYSIFANDLGSWINHAHNYKISGLSETLLFISLNEFYQEADKQLAKFKLEGELFSYMASSFVLPFAKEHKTEMNSIITDMKEWDSNLNNSPMARFNVANIFSKYLTWSLYLSYVKEEFGQAQYDYAKPLVFQQMKDGGFGKFEVFYAAYLKGHTQGESTNLVDAVNRIVLNLR